MLLTVFFSFGYYLASIPRSSTSVHLCVYIYSMTDKRFYRERKSFLCIDGSKIIPFEQVNDDYCDCEDGSDEPGETLTSVCFDKCLQAVCPSVCTIQRGRDVSCSRHIPHEVGFWKWIISLIVCWVTFGAPAWTADALLLMPMRMIQAFAPQS